MNDSAYADRTKVLQALAKFKVPKIYLREICAETGLKPHVVANVMRWFKKYDIVSSDPNHEGWFYKGIKDKNKFCMLHGYSIVSATGRGRHYKPARCPACERRKGEVK